MTDPLDPQQSNEKKIIIDEDWKTQVEREKSASEAKADERKAAETKSADTPPPAQGEAPEAKRASAPGEVPLPSPSLSYLSTSLYYQAIIALGLTPHPVSGKAEIHLPQAKHAIDMLDVLQQKTEGNRTPDESAEIEAMLHQLRLTYLQANK